MACLLPHSDPIHKWFLVTFSFCQQLAKVAVLSKHRVSIIIIVTIIASSNSGGYGSNHNRSCALIRTMTKELSSWLTVFYSVSSWASHNGNCSMIPKCFKQLPSPTAYYFDYLSYYYFYRCCDNDPNKRERAEITTISEISYDSSKYRLLLLFSIVVLYSCTAALFPIRWKTLTAQSSWAISSLHNHLSSL